ncbi:MAG: amidohydrolase family protein [Phycisphaerales bacterium]|nr:amidohydrolase family protein [Phycisphaerales bacterium]
MSDRRRRGWLGSARAWALGGALLSGAAWGQAERTAFVNARIIPIDGPEIERGHLVVHEGRIVAVGAGDPAPGAALTLDCAGKVIMPGLVDTHSHIGGIGGADGSGPIQPGVRVRDSINVRSTGFKRALAGGLTTLNIMPGSGHLSSGQTVYVKLRHRKGEPADGVRTIDDITVFDAQGRPMGGLKMANGTNPQRSGGASGFPETRGKAAFLVRERFLKAQEHQRKLDAAKRDDGTVEESKLPERDLDLETLCEAMRGERVVHHHTHRHDDIITVLRLAEEFGFRVVLHHVSDGWVVADEIAASGAPVSAILVDAPGGKHEAVGLRMEAAGIMEGAGVKVSLHTDDWITDSRFFLRMAALAVRGGMTRAGALASLTQVGADILDMGDRVGSLTPGKDADFIVLSGDPFSTYTVVEKTYVEGRLAFDRSDEADRLFAVGGFGANNDTEPYFCCYDHLLGEGH